MIDKIETIGLEKMMTGYPAIAIEAGHIYTDCTASPLGKLDRQMALKGVTIGAGLSRSLRNRADISKWVFIDELHQSPENPQVTTDEILRTYAVHGFEPDVVVLESNPDLGEAALDVINHIRELSPNRLITMRKGYSLRSTIPGSPNILLAQRDKKGNAINPKCSLIDAALTIAKFQYMEYQGATLTVLPEEYTSQQEHTRQILTAAQCELPMYNIFYSRETSLGTR